MENIDLGSLNYLAVIVAVIFNQLLGAAWYKSWANPWMADVGMTMDDVEAMKGTSMQWLPYVIAIVSTLVFTIALAVLLQATNASSAVDGLLLGLLVSVAFIGTSFATTYSFEGRSSRLFLINLGYPLISYAAIGILLALW